ncbi:MAG TPA: hypothetical protein VGR00_08420, partial [Thermoanaerobaculia bacterium]|nr:hypothetical protein [Thermoanaerobaculia bacterium]
MTICLATILASAGTARAGAHVWQGAASGGVWSTNANWNGGAPTSNEAGGTYVQFDGGVSSTDNISNLTIDTLWLTAGANVLSGTHPLSIGDASPYSFEIRNDTGGNTLASSLPLNLGLNPLRVWVVAG